MKPLTERERRFVDAYIGEAAGNGARAAILAGYARGSAKVTASRLLTRANVRVSLEQKRTVAAVVAEVSAIATLTERRTILATLMRDDMVKASSRIRAIDVDNKIEHVYVEHHHHTHVIPGAITFVVSQQPGAENRT